MNKPKRFLMCVVGPSGCGKSTMSGAMVKKYPQLSEVWSMTTRPARYPNEPGHMYVTKEEFDKHTMVAYTMFDGNEYGVPASMLDDADFYVIDIDGVKTLRQRYSGKELVVVYLDVTPEVAAARMRKRGDSDAKIEKRLANDAVMFSDMEGLAPDYIIDATRDEDAVSADFEQLVKQYLI